MSHMAKDLGSSSRRVKERILIVFVLSRNAEDGPRDKQDGTFISSSILTIAERASIPRESIRTSP